MGAAGHETGHHAIGPPLESHWSQQAAQSTRADLLKHICGDWALECSILIKISACGQLLRCPGIPTRKMRSNRRRQASRRKPSIQSQPLVSNYTLLHPQQASKGWAQVKATENALHEAQNTSTMTRHVANHLMYSINCLWARAAAF